MDVFDKTVDHGQVHVNLQSSVPRWFLRKLLDNLGRKIQPSNKRYDHGIDLTDFVFFWCCFQVSLFSGVIFSWLLFRLHFLHDCFCQVAYFWGLIVFRIVFQVFCFFQVAWKASNFMFRFHVFSSVSVANFLLPNNTGKQLRQRPVLHLQTWMVMEIWKLWLGTGCNCLFLVFFV